LLHLHFIIIGTKIQIGCIIPPYAPFYKRVFSIFLPFLQSFSPKKGAGFVSAPANRSVFPLPGNSEGPEAYASGPGARGQDFRDLL
jgi:hypothetical protein